MVCLCDVVTFSFIQHSVEDLWICILSGPELELGPCLFQDPELCFCMSKNLNIWSGNRINAVLLPLGMIFYLHYKPSALHRKYPAPFHSGIFYLKSWLLWSGSRLQSGSQCCGSGIGCLFDPWIRDPGWVESQHPDPGWKTRIIFFRA